MSLVLSIMLLSQAVTSADVDCDQEKSDLGIQYEMNRCAYKDYLIADEALNVQWKTSAAIMKLRDENFESTYDDRLGYFQTLLKAQRAWITYRDAHCISEGYYARGGSLEPLLVSTCKTELTKDRTKQLQFLTDQ